ncbi:TonB-dependent receptor plug domain-containing protein [Candidatus Auribacterota bacterium]
MRMLREVGIIGFYGCLVFSLFFSSIAWSAEVAPVASESEIYDLMSLSLEDLMNVKITVASKSKAQTIRNAPSVISVVTEQDIRKTGAKTLEEVLRQVVGFDVNPIPVEQNPSVGIRGISNSTNEIVRLLINHHPIGNNFTAGFGYWEGFPVNLIKRIEIIRGPGSALYGDAAMVGVINIITKDWNDAAEISGSYGSFTTANIYGSTSIKRDDLDVYFFADYHTSDGDASLVESDLATLLFGPAGSSAPGYTTEAYKYLNLFTKMQYRDYYGMMMYNYCDTEIPLSFQTTLTDENYRKPQNFFIEFGYEGEGWGEGNLKARLYYDYYVYDFFITLLHSKTTALMTQVLGANYPAGEALYGYPLLKNYKVGGEVTYSKDLTKGLDLITGLQFEYHNQFDSQLEVNGNIAGQVMTLDGINYNPLQYIGGKRDVTNSYHFTIDEDRLVTATYGQLELDIVEKWSLENIGDSLTITFGGRYDDYTDVGSKISPRIGMVYLPNDRVFVKALGGSAFRAPNFRELYNQNNPVQTGNPDLKPETLTTAEATIGVNVTRWMSTFLTIYTTKMKDHIKLAAGGGGLNNFQNIGTLEAQGIEAEVKVALPDKPNTYGYLNVSYQDAKDASHEVIIDTLGTVYTQKDYKIGNVPETMINVGVNWGLTEQINLNLSLNYKGERERSGKLQFTPAAIDADGTLEQVDQRDSIKARTVADLSVIFHDFDFLKDFEIQLTVYNLFDAEDHAPELDGNVLNDIPRWGRHYSVRGTYRF